jgi:tRNA pseudouridine55 synthase
MARKRKGEAVTGWVALDKPLNVTSTQMVGKIRHIFNAQKAGHAGTLDPLATGLLPIALGDATKTVPFLMDADKTYVFTVTWGVSTDSCDAEGHVIARSDARPTVAAINASLPAFIGQITQIPPAFSAIRIDGARAYDLARAGEVVEMPSRTVQVHGLTLDAVTPDTATFTLDCGKGTYVRAIARDLAAMLGVEGHVSALRRTRVGPFSEKNAIGLEKLEDLVHKGALHEALLPLVTALDDIPALAISEQELSYVRQGRAIVLLPARMSALHALITARGGDRTVYATHADQVVALGDVQGGQFQPARVFQ